jgi:hypothetical protein
MPDSNDLDAALVNYLAEDAALTALLPDGVWIDEAPPGAKRFVLVSVYPQRDDDSAVFDGNGRGFELVRYVVSAVGVTTVIDGPQIKDAAARIDALLHRHTLTVPGYPAGATVARTQRQRPPVTVDDDDRSIRWYVRGAEYELHAPN